MERNFGRRDSVGSFGRRDCEAIFGLGDRVRHLLQRTVGAMSNTDLTEEHNSQ